MFNCLCECTHRIDFLPGWPTGGWAPSNLPTGPAPRNRYLEQTAPCQRVALVAEGPSKGLTRVTKKCYH